MEIRTALTDHEITEKLLRALEQHRLPEIFFYRFPLSVQSWIRLCKSKKYRNYERSLFLCKTYARAIAHQLNITSLQWISLGAALGSKERPFLKTLKKRNIKVDYTVVDASQSLLECACKEGEYLGIPTLGVKADFLDLEQLKALPQRKKGQKRLVSIFGNTLGPAGKQEPLKTIASLLKKGDYLVADAEIYDGNQTLKGYNHPINRKFAMAPLTSIGITESDGKIAFEKGPHRNHPGIFQISKFFRFTKDKTLNILGRALHFRKGDRITMSPSIKFSRQGWKNYLEQNKWFEVLSQYQTNDQSYVLSVCIKN